MKLWLLRVLLALPGARWIVIRIATQRIRDELAKLGLEEGKIMGILSGYRTYVTAGLAVLAAIGSYLTGDADLQATLTKVWEVLTALAVIFLRLSQPAPAPAPAPPA